jgi:hypothetical protein
MKLNFYKYLIILVLILSSCKKQTPLPMVEEEKEAVVVTKKRKKIKNPLKFMHAMDKCRENHYCRAEIQFLSILRRGKKEKNYLLLIEALTNSSVKLKTFALSRLYGFRKRSDLIPLLADELKKNSDEGVLKRVVLLLLLNGSVEALNNVIDNWSKMPVAVKLATLWVFRKLVNIIPETFVNDLKNDSIPSIRVAGLEIEAQKGFETNDLYKCIIQLNTQSGFCAMAFSRQTGDEIPGLFDKIIKVFSEKVKLSRKRIKIPGKFILALENLKNSRRISKEKLFLTAKSFLENRRYGDRIRVESARVLGRLGGEKIRILLNKYRKTRRRKVGYAVRRSLYLMEKQ